MPFKNHEPTVWDLWQARSLSEFSDIWKQLELDPGWLTVGALLLGIAALRLVVSSSVDRRIPRQGTYYLGNVALGQNPKIEAPRRLRTRLEHDPEYEADDPAASFRSRDR